MASSLRSIAIPPGSSTRVLGSPAFPQTMPGCATQAEFRTILYLEQRRSERSGRPLLLILLNAEAIGEAGLRAATLAAILATLRASVRETDKLGWYTTASVLGLLFRDVGSADPGLVHDLVNKVSAAVASAVPSSAADAVHLTACLFPQAAHEAVESSNLSSCSKGAERGVQSAVQPARTASIIPDLLAYCRGCEVLLSRPGYLPPAEGGTLGKSLHLPQVSLHVSFLRSAPSSGLRAGLHRK